MIQFLALLWDLLNFILQEINFLEKNSILQLFKLPSKRDTVMSRNRMLLDVGQVLNYILLTPTNDCTSKNHG